VFGHLTCKIDFVGIRETYRKDDEIVRRFLRGNEEMIIAGAINKLKADEKEKAHKYFDVWRKSEDVLEVVRIDVRESHPCVIARELNKAYNLAWESMLPPLGSTANADLRAALQEAFFPIAHPDFLVSNLWLMKDCIPAILDQK
jgi:hypothetical protein